jgi:hypothetical protein
MRTLLEQLGITGADIVSVVHATTINEARDRLNQLKERARKRFYELALELHPDRTGGDETKAREFYRLAEAYRIFSEVQPMQAVPVLEDLGCGFEFSAVF